MGERVGFIVANDAARAAVSKVLTAKVTARQLRVFLAVLDYTAHWSRLTDRVTLAQLAETAGISGKDQRDTEKRVADDLRHLASIGAVVYAPGGRARGVPSTVGIYAVTGVVDDPPNGDFRGVETDLLPGSKPTQKQGFTGVVDDPPPKENLPRFSPRGRRGRPSDRDGSALAGLKPGRLPL